MRDGALPFCVYTMKLIIDLPDWAVEERRHIFIFGGMELMAYKEDGSDWYVKTGRCSQCGKCCMGLGETTQPPMAQNGVCVHLKPDGPKWVCGLGSGRPFSCSAGRSLKQGCTEQYVKVL